MRCHLPLLVMLLDSGMWRFAKSLLTLSPSVASLLGLAISVASLGNSCVAQEPSASVVSTPCVLIPRLLPPEGSMPEPKQSTAWSTRLDALDSQLSDELAAHPSTADVAVLVKACRYALKHAEFYSPKDFAKFERTLKLAEQRASELSNHNVTPKWQQTEGRVVRGFFSKVDGSPQPIGLELPAELVNDEATNDKHWPLIVWLHGRGDKVTDLHFIDQRLHSKGTIHVPDAIVLHPFGRHCVGYKSAGETDVLEAIDFVCENYPVDKKRIVLMGFSMGGAGVWHLAAHYGERFVAASPGAGFAETARYQRLTPDKFPPKYEQILWNVYDVPGYVRNLFNFPIVAYSGEIDKQIQAARVMEEAFRDEGRVLPHLIGPGMGHKYHPETLVEILAKMRKASEEEWQEPTELFLQTKHLRYATRKWITIDGVSEPYADTRVDAQKTPTGAWHIKTKNATRLILDAGKFGPALGTTIEIDESPIQLTARTHVAKLQDKWIVVEQFTSLRKQPGLSGPIDDAFLDPFLVVLPSSGGATEADMWVQCESANFMTRWTSLMRGDVRWKWDKDVTNDDMQKYHLILWGTPMSNAVMGDIFAAGAARQWPLKWDHTQVTVGDVQADARHVLQAIYPNPLTGNRRYVVINSGPTFRQAHDRTNSLQNPHLGDWAIVGLDEPPSEYLPGRIAHTGFFDQLWSFSPSLAW